MKSKKLNQRKTGNLERGQQARAANRIDPSEQQKWIKRQRKKGEQSRQNFFTRNCGSNSGNTKYLILGLVAVSVVGYLYREQLFQSTVDSSMSSRNPGPRSHSGVDDLAVGQGVPAYFNHVNWQAVSQALSVPDADLVGLYNMMHQFADQLVDPGQILFPTKLSEKVHLSPFPLCTFPTGRHHSTDEQKNYAVARQWLHQRRNIAEMTPKQFVSTLKLVNRKIVGANHGEHDFRTTVVWNNVYWGMGLFSEKLMQKLNKDEHRVIARSIISKVNTVAPYFQSMQNADEILYKETILMELDSGVLTKKVRHEKGLKQLVKDSQLTQAEKEFVKRIYHIHSVKPHQKIADNIAQSFKSIVDSGYRVTEKAALLQFFILNEHGFSDGNGRTARAISDEFLRQNDKPPIFYPNHEEYSLVVSKAVRSRNPKLFVEYIEKLIDGKRYLETMQLAKEMQQECIDVKGGSEHCDALLLSAAMQNAKGFCV